MRLKCEIPQTVQVLIRNSTRNRRLIRAAAVLLIVLTWIFTTTFLEGSSVAVRVLLLGDSSVEGSVCRLVAPKADHLEDIIRKCLSVEPDLPPVEVVNQGRDGEFIQGLLQGRYDRGIKPLGRFDYILIRYGINDRARRENFAENFPKDYSALIARLRQDNPQATIIVETTIPFGEGTREAEINKLVRKVAETEKLPLLDSSATFAEALKRDGPNALNYRRMRLVAIPERLRRLLPPASLEVIRNEVVVMDNSLDAHFRDVPGWFVDRHPNFAGYHVLGQGIADFLTSRIRSR